MVWRTGELLRMYKIDVVDSVKVLSQEFLTLVVGFQTGQ